MSIIINNRLFFWALLALPGVAALWGFAAGARDMMEMVQITGLWSARMMIAAMMIAPLVALLGPHPALRWLLARRRALGVAAFAYAVVHLIFYALDMGRLADIIDELPLPGIWTAWAAFFLFVPLALTSNDAAVRALRGAWKRVQRLVYPAALFTLLHWMWVHNDVVSALAHFVPLAILYALRIGKFLFFKPHKLAGA